jgi:hypothetical protein
VPLDMMDLSQLQRAWRQLDVVVGLYEHANAAFATDTTTLTARRFDEAQPGGERTYIQAAQLITVALDNLHTLRHVVTEFGATIWAPWTLLRSMFELAVWVNWMLEPNTSLERRRRGVRRAVLDHREWYNFRLAFALTRADRDQLAETDTTVSAIFRAEAQACGMTWDRARRPVNLIDEIPRLRAVSNALHSDDGDVHPASIAVGIWRGLSGMTHGYAYGAQVNAEVLASVPIPGGRRVTYTIRDASFLANAMMSASLLMSALGIVLERTNYPD